MGNEDTMNNSRYKFRQFDAKQAGSSVSRSNRKVLARRG